MAELNLIPYRMKEEQRKRYRVRQYAAAGIIIFCVLFLGLYFPMGTLLSLQTEEAALQSQIDAQKSVIEENQRLKTQTQQLKHYIQQVDKLDVEGASSVERIRGLGVYMPSGIKLIWLNYTETELSMEGASTDYSDIGEFAANLQMSDEYSNAVISEIKREDSESSYHFLLLVKQGGRSDEKSDN
ncbi:hypothetical protein FRZ06_06625 [Anoxybacterium hadale]|uniref:Uncharacterized protein n=1 Tax=Anoxybacterium hadale TaxID=3408580 RepID=A0ACD1A9A4_9FIRM|nr:hypothetical protein FRZ06_06625 [Clostridiales bacterium]